MHAGDASLAEGRRSELRQQSEKDQKNTKGWRGLDHQANQHADQRPLQARSLWKLPAAAAELAEYGGAERSGGESAEPADQREELSHAVY